MRRCTDGQTLSHLLLPLAGVSLAIVNVERIKKNGALDKSFRLQTLAGAAVTPSA